MNNSLMGARGDTREKTLVSVVAPFYNEEANVAPLAEQIMKTFADLPAFECELVFVNDGSRDGTRAALDRLAAENPWTRPIHLTRNQGQSAALIAGMRRARGEYILTLDGDLQNDPCDAPKFLDRLKEYDCVCGYRAKRRDSAMRLWASRIANTVRRAILDDGLRDSGCGAKAFRRKCVEHIVPFNGAHRFIGVMMRQAGLSIAELEVTHHPRQHGTSKYGIHNRLWRGIYDLFGVRWLKKRYLRIEVEGDN